MPLRRRVQGQTLASMNNLGDALSPDGRILQIRADSGSVYSCHALRLLSGSLTSAVVGHQLAGVLEAGHNDCVILGTPESSGEIELCISARFPDSTSSTLRLLDAETSRL
jgi:hypothetical protein